MRYEDLVIHKLESLKILHDFTLPNTEIDSTKLQSIVDSTDFEAMTRQSLAILVVFLLILKCTFVQELLITGINISRLPRIA